VTTAQSWTLIGGFLAILVAMNALVLGIMRAEMGALRSDLLARLSELGGEVRVLAAKLDALDRDVQRLSERVWRDQPES
jgi:outer membrane murein-binding lipoprotein Lpp